MEKGSSRRSRAFRHPWLLVSLAPLYALILIVVFPVERRFLLPTALFFVLSGVMSFEAITSEVTPATRWLIAIHLLFPLGVIVAFPVAVEAARIWSAHIVLQGFVVLSYGAAAPLAVFNVFLGGVAELVIASEAGPTEHVLGLVQEVALNGALAYAFYHRQRYLDEEHLLDTARKNATMLARANIQLRDRTAQAQNLAVLQDRNRLARDIHDTVGHALTSVVVQLGATLETVRHDREDAERRIEQARETAREGLQQIRASVRSLTGPQVTEPVGRTFWSRAIQTFREVTGIRVVESIEEEFDDVSTSVNEVVFRVIQEGLTNAVRHGQATAVEVDIRRDEDLILVRISDNGVGASKVATGHGLRGLIVRVEALGGEVEWRAIPGTGFDLGADIPYTQEDAT